MANARLVQQIQFIVEVDKLKEIFRQTLLTQSRRQENDAEHSWHICLMVIVLAEHANTPNLDVLKVLQMLLIHDIVEIDAGDTFAYDAEHQVDQHERESRAAERIFGLLPNDQSVEFRRIWDEFEARATAEAKFAAAIDRFQPMLQNCLTEGVAWRQNGVTSNRVIARGQYIADGAAAIWEHAAQLIAEAVQAGHLPKPAVD